MITAMLAAAIHFAPLYPGNPNCDTPITTQWQYNQCIGIPQGLPPQSVDSWNCLHGDSYPLCSTGPRP